jgi:hypothetical protein
MKLEAHNKSRWLAVLGLSTAAAVVCLACLNRSKPASSDAADFTPIVKPASDEVTRVTGRVRKPVGNFYAEQKEKRIRRMIENVVANLPQKDLLQRSAYFTQQVESLADEDVPLILARLDEGLRRSEFGMLLLRRWAEADPRAAATWALNLPVGDERNTLLQQAATLWAEQDLAAANVWVSGLSDAEMRQTVLLALAEETVRTQPVQALDMAGRLAPSPERDQLTIRALSEWATQEPVSAMRWLARVSDAGLQQQMQAALIPVIANVDGNSGAHLTVAWLKPGAEQERIAVAVAQRWAQESPSAAAEWVNRFPEGRMRVAAVDNLVKIWNAQQQEREPVAGGLP